MNDEAFLARLRLELLDAARSLAEARAAAAAPTLTRRRSGRTFLSAAAVAAIVAAVAVVIGSQHDTAAAAVEVIRGDGEVLVRLVDLETRPEEVEAAARDAGIDLSVHTVPVGPSNVGKFIFATAAQLPPAVTATGETATTFTGLRIPDDWRGPIEVSLGRAAEGDEPWTVLSDATAAGEPLACTDIVGRSVDDALVVLSAAELESRWFAFEGRTATEHTGGDLDPYLDWVVVAVSAASPNEVLVEVTADGSWPGPAGTEPVTSKGC